MREASVRRTVTDTDSYAFSFLTLYRQREDDRGTFKHMDIEEVRQVITLLPSEFDSHEFISKYIQHHTASYGENLEQQDFVNSTHGTIALFLKNNAFELGIEELPGKSLSRNIFGNETLNSRWRKL